jgi:hypothetical protein
MTAQPLSAAVSSIDVLPLERTGDASERLETQVTFRTGQLVHGVDVGGKRVP